jgi:hypothetical protein
MSKRPPQSMKSRMDKLDHARRFLKTISKMPMGGSVVEYAPPLERAEVLAIASDILRVSLTPDQNGRYFLTCPGVASHSGGKSARRDCEFLPDGAPTLRCFHESCDGARRELNFSIRSACGKAKVRQFTDFQARATKAAEALLIGYDLSDDDAKALLNEWARGCEPQIPAADLSAGFKSAKRSYGRADANTVGCLLQGRSMPARLASSPRPPQEGKLSVVSAQTSVAQSKPQGGVGLQEPIYVGALGKLAKEVRRMVEDYQGGYGKRPHTILVGTSYEGKVPARLVGISAERWKGRGHSVVG